MSLKLSTRAKEVLVHFSPKILWKFSTQFQLFIQSLAIFLGYLNGHLILPKSTAVKFPIYVRLSLITEEFSILSVEKRLEKERIKQMHPNLLHINMGKKKKDQDLMVSSLITFLIFILMRKVRHQYHSLIDF